MPESPPSRFETLLLRLMRLPEAERSRALERESIDPDLRQKLLDSLGGQTVYDSEPCLPPSAMLEWQQLEDGTPHRLVETPAEKAPAGPLIETIGPYRILEVLGEGGMGVVYLAEQTEPVQRRLAVKVMRAHLGGAGIKARFEAERRALARLAHPNIAQMYEAGTTPEGYPYFAMEHVEGLPITVFCDLRELTIEARLELFMTLCQGVHHAHQRGIIHRDLKPSNILITRGGEESVPKIIDFGIAKALDHPLSDATQLMDSQVLGTLGYMSPESLMTQDDQRDPDIRTDVYALGVLLYELLVGHRPFETRGMPGSAIVGLILAQEPPWPTQRLAELESEGRGAEELEQVAEHRQLGPASLKKRLHGDLDSIVAKAIARDREQRYDSVAELAADVDRHLRHEPVEAVPLDSWYRLSKFAQRNRAGMLATGLIFVTILAAIIGISIGLVRARSAEALARGHAARAEAAEKVAQEEAAAARQVADFLVELFEVSDPSRARGAEVTARELLDRGATRIGQELQGQPSVQARMMRALGKVHRQLGLFEQAAELLEGSLATSLRHLESNDPEVAETHLALGEVYREQGRLEEAEAELDEGLRILGSSLDRSLGIAPESQTAATKGKAPSGGTPGGTPDGRSHGPLEAGASGRIDLRAEARTAAYVSGLRSLATLQTDRGEFEVAEGTLDRALSLSERTHGAASAETGAILWGLGNIARYRGNFQLAQERFRRALAIQEEILPADHPDIAQTFSSLSLVYTNLGQVALGTALNNKALAIYERALGLTHPQVARVLSNMGYSLFRSGNYDLAKEHLERALAVDAVAGAGDHPYVASRLTNLGLVYWRLGRFEEAIPLFERANEIRHRQLTPEHPHRATSLWGLANVYRDLGRLAEAEKLYREALRLRENSLPPGHPELDDALREYAVMLRQTGRNAEAEELESRRVSLPPAGAVPEDDP